MARTPQPDITSRDITGLKYFHQLAPLLERLHDVGCQRDRAGNRDLHYDQYCMLVLLYIFTRSAHSPRSIRYAHSPQEVTKRRAKPLINNRAERYWLRPL